MVIFEISDEHSDTAPFSISFFGRDFPECVRRFEEAKIFDGRTIYEAEEEIEIIYG